MRSSVVLGAILAAACSSAVPASSAQPPAPSRPVVPPPSTAAAADPVAAPQKGRAIVKTGLVGAVVLGPGSAFGGMGGGSGAKPVAGAKVIVSQPGEGGKQVVSTTTDDTGHYEVTVPPGTYTVTLETTVSYRFTKDLPATVTITQDQRTTLNVLLDSGRR